ncbi:MAG: glycosyltransferase family 39 protein [bacterium]
MHFDYLKQNKNFLYGGVIAAIGLLRFINLGFLDLQAWDEALYTVRAQGILHYGTWLDQTSTSIGGLYSALHPPFYVWLTTVSLFLFGENEFAARFVSALCSGLTLPIVYTIGKRLANREVGLFAALFFGLNPFVNFYARQGQFDSTLVFLLALSVLLLIQALEENSYRLSILTGVVIGLGLLTKLFVAFGIPLVFSLWIAFNREIDESKYWRHFIVLLIPAILIAAPWLCYMTVVHGNGNVFFFLKASAIVERSVAGIEGNAKPLEVFYFINQLFVLFPIGVFFLLRSLFDAMKTREGFRWFISLWFIIFFFIFSIMRTKLEVYMLPMLVPASLLAAFELERIKNESRSSKETVVLLLFTTLAVVWSLSQQWRNSLKSLFLSSIGRSNIDVTELLQAIPLLALCLTSSIGFFFLWKSGRLNIVTKYLVVLLFLPFFIYINYCILYRDLISFDDGGKRAAELIESRDFERIAVIGFDRNPQLTYYLKGADIGWRNDLEIERFTPPQNRSEIRLWLTHQMLEMPEGTAIVIEKDKFIRYEWVTAEEVVPTNYQIVFDSRRYAIFSKPKFHHLAEGSRSFWNEANPSIMRSLSIEGFREE